MIAETTVTKLLEVARHYSDKHIYQGRARPAVGMFFEKLWTIVIESELVMLGEDLDKCIVEDIMKVCRNPKPCETCGASSPKGVTSEVIQEIIDRY